MNSHDAAYKDFFKHREMVESLLSGFVPEDVVRELDLSTLEHCPCSYVTEDLRERMDDCVWKVMWRGRASYLCLILEFQSTPDPWMPVRIMTYTGLLWQDLIKTGEIKPKTHLPPVLPIVIYNGAGAWTAPLSIGEALGYAPAGLEPYQSGQKYFLLDEKRCGEAQTAGEGNLFAYMLRFETAKTPEEIQSVLQSLRQRLFDPRYKGLRRLFSVWVGRIVARNMGNQENIPEFQDLQEVETMLAETVASWKDAWRAEGLAAGRAEGLAAGRAEGIAAGRAEGITAGRAEGRLGNLTENIRALMESLSISREKAMDML
ncbi:MAG: Rpn family recombination-promoting nuclease/putative transposase [Desulfovibrionaceae bacterium]|nr:Rpn family recombination-promoting nuclease/putative transposase [Desulfovibrionaceae bacterium]